MPARVASLIAYRIKMIELLQGAKDAKNLKDHDRSGLDRIAFDPSNPLNGASHAVCLCDW